MISIVGGSIAGMVTAMNVKKTEDVVIFEEHQVIGYPFQCSGLINKKVFDKNFRFAKQCIQNKIKGCKVISPNGKEIIFKNRQKAYVVYRPFLEQYIYSKLERRSNVVFYFSKRVENEKELNGRYIVGADGTFSWVRKYFGFGDLDHIAGVQYEVKMESELESDLVHIYVDKRFSPYHVWCIPVSEKIFRIGLASHNIQDGINKLNVFLKRFSKVRIINKMYGYVPVGVLDSVVKNNVCLIGDAAGQNRPLSGGGLNLAVIFGKVLGRALSKDRLDHYQKMWDQTKLKYKDELNILHQWLGMNNKQIEKKFAKPLTPDFKDSTFFTAIFRALVMQ